MSRLAEESGARIVAQTSGVRTTMTEGSRDFRLEKRRDTPFKRLRNDANA
ncbi:MAG: hypothetical protein HDQ93_05255 [Desulfovibrio sp.]|nr:hypothetical protein [Desulfovibrio sp.]